MSSLKYWIWLASADGVGIITAMQLLRHFGTPENVYLADVTEYREAGSARFVDCSKLADKNLDAANKILASCQQCNCRVITQQDAEYPDRLRNIYDPPLVLYIRGNLPSIDEEAAVAIVGTRDCTPYGISSAENIAFLLARRGLLVVTGLARGIDTAAARAALRGGGRVIGVIGSGIDVIYPPENASLFDDVASSGALISEYPPGTPAFRTHFPARNRIVSGLSLGVTVIEAPKKSGALITATRALEQGRDVFTLPGNVDASSCEGSNSLLREGAIPILSGEDIVSEYAGLFPDKISDEGSRQEAAPVEIFEINQTNLYSDRKKDHRNDKKEIDNKTVLDYIVLDEIFNALTGDEKTVAKAIGATGMQVDDIIINTGLSTPQVLTALTMLEINGYVQRDENGKWNVINNNEVKH